MTAYLPLAWDRYLLPLQAGSALLAAGAAAAAADRLADRSPPGGRSPAASRALGLRHPAGELRLLLALARLEQRQPSDADLFHRRSRHDLIDGLDEQTGDKAFFGGHYYTDKLPGFSLLATGPYALAKLLAAGFPTTP